MAVHGRFRKTVSVCGPPDQRIVYTANEVNYCPRSARPAGGCCADRSLSRLLKDDWPAEID